MQLRVLDDGRPGYAVLEFDSLLEEPILHISVRSALQDSFLGPGGQWQRTPHFFSAQQIDSDASAARYRVGPEIVNHMLEFDRVEIATKDNAVRAEAEWQNAVPEITAGSGHTIYRAPEAPSRPAPAPAARMYQPAVALPQQDAKPPAEAPKAPPTPPLQRPDPEQIKKESPPPPPPPTRPKWLVAAIVAGAVLAVLVAGFFLNAPCRLFGIACPPPPVDEAFERSRVCAEQKSNVAPCDVDACFNDYLAATPSARNQPKVQRILNDAHNECSKRDEQAAKTARECADARRAANKPCEVEAACIASYLSAFPSGRFRDELAERGRDATRACPNEAGGAKAARDCAAQKETAKLFCDLQSTCIAPYVRAFPNGASRAVLEARGAAATRVCAEQAAAQTARECVTARRAAANCDVQNCVQTYTRDFPNGASRGELEGQARSAAAACDDERDFASANSCAGITDPCRVEEVCVRPYLTRHPNGRERVQSAIDRAAAQCPPPARPASPLPTGTYKLNFDANAQCSEHAQFTRLHIEGTTVSWEHDFQRITYTWTGTIDADGNITASAPLSGTQATGRYHDPDQYVDLTYPQCGPIHGRILGRVQ